MTRYPCRKLGNWTVAFVLAAVCIRAVPGWNGWALAVMAWVGTWLADNVTETDQ